MSQGAPVSKKSTTPWEETAGTDGHVVLDLKILISAHKSKNGKFMKFLGELQKIKYPNELMEKQNTWTLIFFFPDYSSKLECLIYRL